MILGTGIMLILLTITFAIVQTFIIRNNGWDAQMAADSIADGTAVYMATDGNNYNDAVKKSKELQSIVKKNTGIDTKNVTVNKNKLKDDDEVQIDLSVTDQYIKDSYKGQKGYTLNRTSTTKFNKNGISSGSIIGIAQSKLGSRYYWGKQGPDEFDCSGFVYWCYRQAGATGPYMTTFGLVAKFAGTKYEVNDKNDLQPGDVIICNGIQHVVFYFGNGQTIGCSGGGSGTHGDNPNACVKFQNYEQTYKHNTTHIFRLPVEAY